MNWKKWIKEKKEEDESFKEVKLTGKKNQLVDRILKILNGDVTGTKKKRRKDEKEEKDEKSKESEEKEVKKRKKNE